MIFGIFSSQIEYQNNTKLRAIDGTKELHLVAITLHFPDNTFNLKINYANICFFPLFAQNECTCNSAG